jgi:polycomb protein EED
MCSAVPLQTLHRNPPREAPIAIATSFAPTPTVPKSRSQPGEKDQGGDSMHTGPQEPDILPLLPLMVKLGPGEGLGCEVAQGSITPTHEREYKLCDKHTEGKLPIYGIDFNFLDARYYNVFATVGGNRVSFGSLACILA